MAPHAELSALTLARFRDGDPDALAQVYDRYNRAVWSVAVTIARDQQLAQDAMQETFIRAWRAANSYDPARDLGPWLMTIARHATLDLIRRESRPTRGGHEAEQDVVVEDAGVERAWTAWQVQEAIRQLGEQERVIVQLAFLEDLSQAQIAERLGIPLGTVKSRAHRAHRQLAQLLAHLGDVPVDDANRSTAGGRIPSGQLRAQRRWQR